MLVFKDLDLLFLFYLLDSVDLLFGLTVDAFILLTIEFLFLLQLGVQHFLVVLLELLVVLVHYFQGLYLLYLGFHSLFQRLVIGD